MYDQILVPTDGSDGAHAALMTAATLAATFDATVRVISVAASRPLPKRVRADAEAVYRQAAAEAVEAAGEELEAADVDCSTEVVAVDGHVHEAIIEYARDNEVDLICMGSHGRTGLDRMLLGSVAERTIRAAPMPVLTVKGEPLADPVSSMLVPTDGSDGARVAGEHAFAFAAAVDASVRVVHVIDVAALGGEFDTGQIYREFERMGERAITELRTAATEAGLEDVNSALLTGRPARAIVEDADEQDVDLIVLGTRGASGLDRYLLGSVAEKVVRSSTVPVLTLNAGRNRTE